jgi:hypothetical protein
MLIITPRAISCSEDSMWKVHEFAAEEVVRVLTGQQSISAVKAA